jgi:hypothetical protein
LVAGAILAPPRLLLVLLVASGLRHELPLLLPDGLDLQLEPLLDLAVPASPWWCGAATATLPCHAYLLLDAGGMVLQWWRSPGVYCDDYAAFPSALPLVLGTCCELFSPLSLLSFSASTEL